MIPDPVMRAADEADEVLTAQTTAPMTDEAPWPEPLGDDAYHGLAGDIVRAIEPDTEADPAALLIQLLAAFGNVVGRHRYYFVDGVKHHGNLFAATVGPSSKARKGTSWARVRGVIDGTSCTNEWLRSRVMSGLSSGEGLIEQVRDPITKATTDKDGKPSVETVDDGVKDKRLLIVETEFSRVLRVMLRTDNTLSAIVRDAWDGGDLHVLTRKSPLHATEPHVSIIAHTTVDDIRQHLSAVDIANGFGNRFLYVCTKRTKLLPLGGDYHALRERLTPLEVGLANAINNADPNATWDSVEQSDTTEIKWAGDEARACWCEFYEKEAVERPGMLGAITARGEAQVVRLTLLYALLDQKAAMGVEHLKAAIALWDYCKASTRHIFGDRLGDATADTILAALRGAGEKGMTRSAIVDVFDRHKPATEVARALGRLSAGGYAIPSIEPTRGRPIERWRVARPAGR